MPHRSRFEKTVEIIAERLRAAQLDGTITVQPSAEELLLRAACPDRPDRPSLRFTLSKEMLLTTDPSAIAERFIEACREYCDWD